MPEKSSVKTQPNIISSGPDLRSSFLILGSDDETTGEINFLNDSTPSELKQFERDQAHPQIRQVVVLDTDTKNYEDEGVPSFLP